MPSEIYLRDALPMKEGKKKRIDFPNFKLKDWIVCAIIHLEHASVIMTDTYVPY